MKLYISKTIGLPLLGAAFILPLRLQADDPKTEIQYLSGRGPKDAVPWNFKIEGGRRSGEATTIPVPSNWELHGFGNYTFGLVSVQTPETGFYSRKFTIPESWTGRRINIVFNGVMTDAIVKVKGKLAGPTHIGAFYQFKYDITRLLKKDKGAEHLLEVEVAKSARTPRLTRPNIAGTTGLLEAFSAQVWQSRLRGTWLGIHETAYNDIQPGESWGYPEFQGMFSGLRWADLETSAGRLTVASASPEVYLRVGSPQISHEGTTVAFPAGDLSLMDAIPGIGSKIDNSSSSSGSAKAISDYYGTFTFRFAEAKP